MGVYPLVSPHKVKRYLEGLRVLCLGCWKRKGIHGFLKLLGGKYGVFDRTRYVATLGWGWTTISRRESCRGGKGKATKLKIDLIALWDTLPRVQVASWWEL